MSFEQLKVLFRHIVRSAARSVLAQVDGLWHAGYIAEPGPSPHQLLVFELPTTQKTVTSEVFSVLRYLIPRDLVDLGKRRVGGDNDGGYVMVDCITPSQPILSIGVGPDVSFDFDLAEQGHAIVMFDHTVDSLPTEHERFTWHRLGAAATAAPEASLITLADMAAMLPKTGGEPILKIDIENAEWEPLAAASRDTLAQFAQITIELHGLLDIEMRDHRALVKKALENLTADFVIVHIHPNSCGMFGYVGGFPMPDVLELTLIRRDLAATVPSQTWYPTPLDRSNWRGGTDVPLWAFPFAPGSETLELASP